MREREKDREGRVEERGVEDKKNLTGYIHQPTVAGGASGRRTARRARDARDGATRGMTR